MTTGALAQDGQRTATLADTAPSPTTLRGQRGKIFHNWAGTFQCKPELYFLPRSVSEIQEIIRLASLNRKHLTVVGSGHSPGDITCTDDYMINLDNLSSLIEVRREDGIVRVQAGMRLYQLHKHLDENHLAMSNLGSISDQSIAGFISTGTHGSSLRHSLLSDAVLEIKMILADGSQLTCSRSLNRDIFLAALVSLGALGIIYEITLQVSQAFAIESTQSIHTFAQMIAQWRAAELWQTAEFVRVWWFPYSAQTVVWKGDRVAPDAQILQPAGSWYRDTLWAYHIQQAFLYLGRFVPSLSPTIERIVFKQHYGTKIGLVSRAVEKSDVALNMNCLFSQYVNEWSVPLEKGPEACERLNAWLNGREKESGIPYSSKGIFVHAPIELRVSAAREDDAWLSTTTGGSVCYIGIIMYKPFYTSIPYRRYFQAYEYLMRSLGGRPHWAKHYNMSQAALRALYPKMDDWLNVRKKLDPAGLFTNEYHRRHLLTDQDKEGLSGSLDVEGRRFKARL